MRARTSAPRNRYGTSANGTSETRKAIVERAAARNPPIWSASCAIRAIISAMPAPYIGA